MATDVNFEAQPLLNEDAFETYEELDGEFRSAPFRRRRFRFRPRPPMDEEFEESEVVVRDQRTGRGGGPRVRFAPGFGGSSFAAQPFRRAVTSGRPFVGPSIFRGPMFRVPLFAGRPIGGRFGFFGAPVFRRGPFFGGGRFGGGFGFRRPIGFGGRFGRFGFRRRWPWMSGGGFGGDTGFAGAGQVSALVSWAQNCLSQAGDQSVPQNGILGPATRRAISAFQQQQQLAATGVLDNQTIAALQAACSPQDGGGDQGDAGGAQDGQ